MMVAPMMRYSVRVVAWRDAVEVLQAIRGRVFIEEQRVPPDLERDGSDDECLHVLAETDAGEPVGTGRLRSDGRIGRMAVLAEHRGHGAGAAILRALCEEARARGFRELELHAQTSARGFYERAGWTAHGLEYLEAGIPHVDMRKRV